MRTTALLLAALTSVVSAGKYHDPSQPCFRKSDARDEVLTHPKMHEVLDMSAAPASMDWRQLLQSMGGSISAARQQVSTRTNSTMPQPGAKFKLAAFSRLGHTPSFAGFPCQNAHENIFFWR
jgi:hypothetical protein